MGLCGSDLCGCDRSAPLESNDEVDEDDERTGGDGCRSGGSTCSPGTSSELGAVRARRKRSRRPASERWRACTRCERARRVSRMKSDGARVWKRTVGSLREDGGETVGVPVVEVDDVVASTDEDAVGVGVTISLQSGQR